MRHQIRWSDDILTGYELIDHDHRMIWAYINEFLSLRHHGHYEVERAIGRLVNYTKEHFNREEEGMAAANYPDLKDHRTDHEYRIYQIESQIDKGSSCVPGC